MALSSRGLVGLTRHMLDSYPRWCAAAPPGRMNLSRAEPAVDSRERRLVGLAVSGELGTTGGTPDV
jgi:hypothetical protein